MIEAVQTLIPLFLIGWLWLAPPTSLLGFWAQAAAIALALLAGRLAGIWLLLPWWTPVALVLPLVFIVGRRFRRFGLGGAPLLPPERRGWLFLIGFAVVDVALVQLCLAAMADRAGRVEPVEIAMPARGGHWLVVHGGHNDVINPHMATLLPQTDRQRAYRGQSYAVDLIALPGFGVRLPSGRDPAEYPSFGRWVVAPCNGKVVATRDDRSDMPVPYADEAVIEGNHVLVACDGFEVFLGHLRKGSVLVERGQAIAQGDALGQVGNSGKSTSPHLHVHAQTAGPPAAPFGGDPLRTLIDGEVPKRGKILRGVSSPRSSSPSP